MTKKMIADVQITNDVTINNNPVILSVNGVNANTSGNVDIPMYTTEEVDKMIAMLPVTRVGTMDYLPLNINGSFEGASNYVGKALYPCIIENDGTLVYLRAGTNGSTYGFYYAYVKNARNVNSLSPILSNEKFTPSFFTPNHSIDSFIGSNTKELLMFRTNNGSISTYTISLTNGTMNPVSHQSVEFPRTSMSGYDPQYVIKCGNLVYIFCLGGYNNSSPFAITIFTISEQDIINGVYSSLVKITGISGQSIFGDAISSSSTINLANMYVSTNSLDKPWFYVQPSPVPITMGAFHGSTDGMLHAETTNDNIRISIMRPSYVSTSTNIVRNFSVISLVYNTVSKNYSIDNTVKGQSIISSDPSGNITWVNPYSTQSSEYNGIDSSSIAGRTPTFFNTSDGIQLCVISGTNDENGHRISRAKYTNFVSAYDSWNFNTFDTNTRIITNVSPVYGSAIGENLIAPTIISANKIFMKCAGTYNGVSTGYDNTSVTSLSGSPTYVYNSINTGTTINGYAPNTNRQFLNNTGYKYTGCITIVNQDGSTEVYGSSFIEGVSKHSALEMDQTTLQFNQQITISPTLLSDIKSGMFAGVSFPYPVTSSKLVLYYVPNNTYTKSFAVMSVAVGAPLGTPNVYFVLSELDVSISSNNVDGYVLHTNTLLPYNATCLYAEYPFLNRRGGITIAKYSEFTYVGIQCLANVQTSTSPLLFSILCKVNNSTKLIYGSPKLLRSSWVSNNGSTYDSGVLPNIGFGLFENGVMTDLKTKLIFSNFGTTESQFDAMVINPASTPVSKIVVAAQDVPEGYVIYFTQEIPVLLSGKFFKLPPQSINLQDLFGTVQNKTFYLYVSIIGDIPQYQITDVLQSEELFRVYIGTIITDASGITSITSEKVTRFLTYRTSSTQRGSAIPVSTGIPSGSGTRWS